MQYPRKGKAGVLKTGAQMMVVDFSIRIAKRSPAAERPHVTRTGPSSARTRHRGRLALGLVGTLCVLLLPALAGAQGEAAPAAQPSVVELKAAAYDAQQRALAAEAEAERVRTELAEAQRAAQSTPPVAPPPTPAPAPIPVVQPVVQPAAAPPPPPAPILMPVAMTAAAPAPPVVQKAAATEEQVDALEEAVRQAQADAAAAHDEAEEARREAREAKAEIEAFKAKHALRFARKGLSISAHVFYAPEIFDTTLSVENGQGMGLVLGYRLHENFELSLQSDRVTGFEFSGDSVLGEVQGWTATANAKAFILTGSFQPFIGFGIGAFYATLDAHDNLGNRVEDSQAAGLFKLNGGFDYYISERLAITADAAIYLPGGELSALTFSTLGGGVKLRF